MSAPPLDHRFFRIALVVGLALGLALVIRGVVDDWDHVRTWPAQLEGLVRAVVRGAA